MGAWFGINWGGWKWWQHYAVNNWNVSICTSFFLPTPTLLLSAQTFYLFLSKFLIQDRANPGTDPAQDIIHRRLWAPWRRDRKNLENPAEHALMHILTKRQIYCWPMCRCWEEPKGEAVEKEKEAGAVSYLPKAFQTQTLLPLMPSCFGIWITSSWNEQQESPLLVGAQPDGESCGGAVIGVEVWGWGVMAWKPYRRPKAQLSPEKWLDKLGHPADKNRRAETACWKDQTSDT